LQKKTFVDLNQCFLTGGLQPTFGSQERTF
jgi:hypothetical protein